METSAAIQDSYLHESTDIQKEFEGVIMDTEKQSNNRKIFLFHGACQGCINQLHDGFTDCVYCRYFDGELDMEDAGIRDYLPDLIYEAANQEMIERIRIELNVPRHEESEPKHVVHKYSGEDEISAIMMLIVVLFIIAILVCIASSMS